MTEKEAWKYLADCFKEEKLVSVPKFDNKEIVVCAIGPSFLCERLERLLGLGYLSFCTHRKMMGKIQNKGEQLEIFDVGLKPIWPLTKEGHAQRRAFCLKMAGKCQS